jgi:biopolymer transport protein ExbB
MNIRSLFNSLSRVFRVVLLAGAVTLVAGSLVESSMAQEPAAPAAEGAAQPAGHKATLMDKIKQGGWVMWPIAICSIFTIYLVVDIYLRTADKKLAPDEEVEKAQQLFMAGDYVNAYQVMKATPCAYNNIVKYGLSYVGKGKDQTEEALLVELGRENARLQNKINYLSVIGVCTPMIGLLGTVVGMMGAFDSLGTSGAGDTSALSHHIGEVLIATASGLFIAIPAFMFFYILRNRLLAKMHDLEDKVMNLFRNMPYEHFHGLEIGEEVTYAALPNWLGEGAVAQ